ncbi:LptF/LptG family permease [Segatella bryantii]|jgi:lipopolysaccharide export system permease protein|uniref:LptF/LptG family permease n=1 Tax=Segatella bryantii TaxID=77095 RepID=UPI001EDB9BD8|nr:LptF/LptG family permease [Segatella bryantii]UKK72805.1 LptF/LptG family permease [Segatella bryantii]
MLRIKKLDIFLAKQFGLLFAGTFFICQFVLMMQFLWRYVDDLIGKGIPMTALAQFFWYMGLMMVPQALPLAILLSSLITLGNLGESSELTAIKAAGISLLQALRSLIVITCIIMMASFYFENNLGPDANMKLSQLLISMKQKSPELEIPEGVFYDGIPNSNIYVQKKDLKSGKLYGIMIYRMTQSYEDAAIILADSGMMQSTAEKKHLILKLWSGEWFENMRSDELGNSAAVPYRRETFTYKKIVLDFDGDFNLTDAAALSNNAQGKSLAKIRNDLDSINLVYDSIGRNYLRDLNMLYYNIPHTERRDSLKALQLAYTQGYNIDSIFGKLSTEQKQQTVASALAKAQNEMSDLEFKSLLTSDGDKNIRRHRIEMVNKFTVALSCLIFFFIGAPLGAIIRKGGLGVPVIISVLVFIIYYILDNSGFRMAREGIWAIWFGKGLAPGVLTPIAIFVTYKANKDSVVFNVDVYRNLLMKALGLRLKRHIPSKEVIIEEPNYQVDALQLQKISQQIAEYNTVHRLKKAPNPIRVFFKYKPDHAIEMINEELEKIIENLANTKDQQILRYINQYPIMAVKAHTRPFEKKWKNIIAAIIIPAGLFFYMRMWRFRLRLLRDLKITSKTNEQVIARIQEM